MYTIEKWYNKVYVLAISVYGFMNVFLLEYRHKDRSGKKQTEQYNPICSWQGDQKR